MLGFLNLFKPAGPTSTQFGARLRRMYATDDGTKLAVGHLGTLDPQAAGVLPVALGRATRLLPLIEDRRKAYAFTLVLGRATVTADGVGAVIATAPVPDGVDELLDAAVAASVAGYVGRREHVRPREHKPVDGPSGAWPPVDELVGHRGVSRNGSTMAIARAASRSSAGRPGP